MATDTATSADGGVSNLSCGSFTGAGEAVDVTLGFKPRRVHLINITDGIEHLWQEGMPAATVLQRIANGTASGATGSLIVPKGGPDGAFRGFTVAAGAAISAKEYVYSAWG